VLLEFNYKSCATWDVLVMLIEFLPILVLHHTTFKEYGKLYQLIFLCL